MTRKGQKVEKQYKIRYLDRDVIYTDNISYRIINRGNKNCRNKTNYKNGNLGNSNRDKVNMNGRE